MKRRHTQGDPTLVLDAARFGRMLDLERRRSERTGTQFALALVHLDSLGDVFDTSRGQEIAADLAEAMRETDITGWYRAGGKIGVILTTLNGAPREEAEPGVVSRIRDVLAFSVGAPTAARIRVSCHFFPDDDEGGGPGGVMEEGFPLRASTAKKRRVPDLKRALDVSGSLAALVALTPVFVLVALVIRLTSPGPVFFRQTRVGRFGKEFTLLKFRSMYVGNDPDLHKQFVTRFISSQTADSMGVYKIRNDPRVTPVGKFLRRNSLDELPQFINVLLGDMSLVGPRPAIPYELEKYGLWHLRRIQEAKPGITGEWQVNGRSRTTFDEMVRMDLRYIENQSLWLDLRILLKTPMAVIGGDGAH